MCLMKIWAGGPNSLRDMIENSQAKEGKAVIGPIVQELIDRGKAQGLAQGLIKGEAKGLAKGLARGEAKGLACALTRLLEHRFGTLPRAVRRWITSAPASELDARFTDSLDAKSLAEVLPELDLD